MGALNLYVAYSFSTDAWVNFKLFGGIGLMLAVRAGAGAVAREVRRGEAVTRRRGAIRERLAALEPESLDLVDECALHAGHEGAASGGGHYRLLIVSPRFRGQGAVERHRMVYDALGPMMRQEIHALSIQALRARGTAAPSR